MSKPNAPNPQDIDATVNSLAVERRNAATWWRQAGLLVDVVEREGSWQTGYSSLTDFVERVAERTNRSANMIWRAYGAVRTWRELQPKVAQTMAPVTVPAEVDQLPAYITVETIELLEKISRVAEPGVWKEIVEAVMWGRMSRSILRARWATLREADKTPPKPSQALITPVFLEGSDSPHNNELSQMVLSGGPTCLGYPDPARYAIYKNLYLPVDEDVWISWLDVVFVIQAATRGPIEIHGVVTSSLAGDRVEDLRTLAAHCGHFVDSLWFVATSDTNISEAYAKIPHVGLLLRGYKDELYVQTRPWPNQQAASRIEELAKRLLLEEPVK